MPWHNHHYSLTSARPAIVDRFQQLHLTPLLQGDDLYPFYYYYYRLQEPQPAHQIHVAAALAVPKPLARKACVSPRIAQAAAQVLRDDGKLLHHVLPVSGVSREQWSALIGAKYRNALVALGEAMDCVAVQSIGEPLMQMTFDTFHLAGAGVNMTLGILQLHEIIMTTSRTLKTLTMSIPLASFVTDQHAV